MTTDETKRAKDNARKWKWAKEHQLSRAITLRNYWTKRVEMLQKQEELDESSSQDNEQLTLTEA